MLPTVQAKAILQRREQPQWFGTQYNMNLYRGCPHGCIYCDSRSTCYHLEAFDLVREKAGALDILRGELARIRKPGVVCTGAMSDPYNPFEFQRQLTRGALQLLGAQGFGIAIATKSDLVARDGDVLEMIKARAPALVKVTITCAQDKLSQKLEPGAPPSSHRFKALEALAKRGIACGVLMTPLLPWISDTPENIQAILASAASAGAFFVYPGLGLSMRDGNREYLYAQLDRLFPGLKARYAQQYGGSYWCLSPRAEALWALLKAQCKQLGLLYRMEDIIAHYQAPYRQQQMSWLPEGIKAGS